MARERIAILNRLLRPFWLRIQLIVGRFVISAVDESRKLRTLQLEGLVGETLAGVEYFQHWGLASRPKLGAEAIGVFVEGLRDHGVIIATADRRWKITLAEGEVALFDDLGQRVKLARDGIELDTPYAVAIHAGGAVTVEADGDATVSAGGAAMVEADGDATVSAGAGATVEAEGDATVSAGAAVTIDANGNVTVNAGGIVNLGGLGGAGVCRIGDQDDNGDSMVQGSAKVFAV